MRLRLFVLAALVASACGSPSSFGGPSVKPTTAPSPRVAMPAKATPVVISVAPTWGPIAAGTYRMASLPFVIVTIPTGWEGTGPVVLRKHFDEPTEVLLAVHLEDLWVYADACVAGTQRLVGGTAQDLIDALISQQSTEVSEPVDARIGALAAKRVEIRIPSGLDVGACSDPGLHIWSDPMHETNLAIPPSDPSIVVPVWIADTSAGRVVVTVGSERDATEADIAERDAIFDSIRLD